MRRSMRGALLVIAGTIGGCGDPVAPTPTEYALSFVPLGGLTLPFQLGGTTLSVTCGPWEQGLVPVPAVHVRLTTPLGARGGWHLRAVRADVQIGVPLPFPNSFLFDQPERADLFVTNGSAEWSSQLGGSTGSVTFESLECGGGGVALRIDAVLEDELGGMPLAVSGRLRAGVGARFLP